MSRGPGVEERDHGRKAAMERTAKLGGAKVAIGLLGNSGSAGDKSGLTLVQLGAVHEFGTSRVPQRSFIRATTEDQRSALNEVKQKLAKEVQDGHMTRDQALGSIGAFLKGKIQERISAIIPPPNAPSTIRKKGSSTPLIDTGRLRQSIAFEVRADENAPTVPPVSGGHE